MTDTYMASGLPMCDGSKSIQFRCHKGIAFWNACCSNIDISLTP